MNRNVDDIDALEMCDVNQSSSPASPLSLNPLHSDVNDDDDNDGEDNGLITQSKVVRSSKWTIMKRVALVGVSLVIAITIIDAIIMYMNKFILVDIHRVDLYLQPEVVQYGDASIKISSRTLFQSILHSAQVKPDSTSCSIFYQNDNSEYLLTKATLRSPFNVKPVSYGSNTDKLAIGFSDVGYATIKDMMMNGPKYQSGKSVVQCTVAYDVYAFSFIPFKNNKFHYDSSTGSSTINVADTLKSIFESADLDKGSRRLEEDSSSFNMPLKFYDYSYSFDKDNSISQFALTATTKIDSSNVNIPFQVGLHIPALKLLFGHSNFDANTNKNQYSNSYVFETEGASVDLINPDYTTANFKAKMSCSVEGEACSLIYPLSAIFTDLNNGTAMATSDFINENNIISSFLGITHKMTFKKYNETTYLAAPSRSLLSSTELSRNLVAKKPTPRPTKKPTPRPTKKPTPRPTARPTTAKPTTTAHPTWHPTRQVLPTFENYWYSDIHFDDWQLFKASLFFTDIGADFKVNVAIDTFKIVNAHAILTWTNEVPLTTSASLSVDILDGYIVGNQNLFLNELDEFVTETASLIVNSNDALNLNMNGKYYNLKPDIPVTDNFLIEFDSIKLTLNNDTIAIAAVNLTVDAVADGYMAINYNVIKPTVQLFNGFQWNFDLDADKNYFGIKSLGNIENENPVWNAETYFVYNTALGSTENPSPYTYYFNVDGQANSRIETFKPVSKIVCPISIYLGETNVYWYYPSDYNYWQLEDVLFSILSRGNLNIQRDDVKQTDSMSYWNSMYYWWRSRTSFNYNVYFPSGDVNACFKIEKILSDNSFDYSNAIRYQVSSYLGPFLSIVSRKSYPSHITEKVVTSSIKPFTYASRGEGTYGFDGFTRFDILMTKNSVQANNDTLTSFQGGLNVNLNSDGFLNLNFIEVDHGHFNFKTNNELAWHVEDKVGDISIKAAGAVWRSLDWTLNAAFNFKPDDVSAKKDYSLDFDLNGNTYTTKGGEDYDTKGSLTCMSSSFNLNKYSWNGDLENIQGTLDNVKMAFVNTYNIYDVNVEIEDLNTQYFQNNGNYYICNYHPSYSCYYYWDYYRYVGNNYYYYNPYDPLWSYNPYQNMQVKVSLPVASQVECDYINFHSNEFTNLLRQYISNFYYYSVNFYTQSSWDLQSSPEFQQSHPFSISQSINGNYYDGNTDVLLTVNDAKLTVNGDHFDYNGNIMYDNINDNIAAGFRWMDQLDSSMTLGWDISSGERGAVTMGARTALKNVAGIVDVASNANINFQYSPGIDAHTQFSLASSAEGHGVDYYKKTFNYGYWTTNNQLPTCKITVKIQDSNIAMYPADSVKESIMSQLNSQLDQRNYRWLLNVESVEISSFRDFYEFDIIVKQLNPLANFQCNDVINSGYYLTISNLNVYNINFGMASQNSVSNVCPDNTYYSGRSEYRGYWCVSDCYYSGYYYGCNCNYHYDYYYECQGGWQYVEFSGEEKAHTLSFNIDATSNGHWGGSLDETWFCEVEEAKLQVNGRRAIDAEVTVYNMLPTYSPTLSPSRSLNPTFNPTVIPYLDKVSPTYYPTKNPTPRPTKFPTSKPTFVPTNGGSANFGDHVVTFDVKEKLSKIDIGVVANYGGSTNDFKLLVDEISLKVGDSIITENAIGGKVSYTIPSNGEFGKVLIESWDHDNEKVIYDLANSIEWAKKGDKFYLGLGSSFTVNDINLYDAGFNTSIVNKPNDFLLGLGSDLDLDDIHIFDVNVITEWFSYDNRPDKPTLKPSSKPTLRPTFKPSKKPTYKPSKKPIATHSPSRKPSPNAPSPNAPSPKAPTPTRKAPTWSHRFPNIAPSRRYVYRTHSPTKKPTKK